MTIEVRQGDCLDVLPELRSGSIALVYLDPPFFTQKVHRLRTRDRKHEFSFDDLWSSHSDYARFLRDRLLEAHRVLGRRGSIFFHCDRRTSHIARALLDDVFGRMNFRSEVIWHYRRWSNSRRSLLPAHQTLYFYSKSDSFVFNPIYVEYSPSTNVDQLLQRRKRDEFGKPVYERDGSGRVVPNGPKRGVPLSDVWDIPYLNPKAKERVGYPTQKPVLLLERIIDLVTREGDVVVDPFCGSGTTLVAACLMGRGAIGIDISAEAIAVTKDRLSNPTKTHSTLLQIGRESYRTADENALALLRGLDCVPVHRNRGIDAILTRQHEGRPVPIRVQRKGESVPAAADMLWRAARTKQAKMMILVVTHRGGDLGLRQNLPPNVVTVESPAAQIEAMFGFSHEKGIQDRLLRSNA